MNKYKNFDGYLKEFPTTDGYFGKYGGNYLDNPELINEILKKGKKIEPKTYGDIKALKKA